MAMALYEPGTVIYTATRVNTYATHTDLCWSLCVHYTNRVTRMFTAGGVSVVCVGKTCISSGQLHIDSVC